MKKFFTMRVVIIWHRFPRESVAAPFLKVFQARLGMSWSSVV